MDDVALAWLSMLAGAAVGEPVMVKALARDDVLGLAGRDASGWAISLAPDLGGDDALEVLMHECAHIALGHIARDRESVPRPAGGSILERLTQAREAPLEDEAQAWAAARLSGLGDRVRWLTRALLDG